MIPNNELCTMLQTIRFTISKLSAQVGMSWLWISIFLLSSCTSPEGPAQSVKIVLSSEAGGVARRASEILAREITLRSGAKVSTEGKADFTLELAIESGIGSEGYTIAEKLPVTTRMASSMAWESFCTLPVSIRVVLHRGSGAGRLFPMALSVGFILPPISITGTKQHQTQSVPDMLKVWLCGELTHW